MKPNDLRGSLAACSNGKTYPMSFSVPTQAQRRPHLSAPGTEVQPHLDPAATTERLPSCLGELSVDFYCCFRLQPVFSESKSPVNPHNPPKSTNKNSTVSNFARLCVFSDPLPVNRPARPDLPVLLFPITLDIRAGSATFRVMSKTVKDAPPAPEESVNLPFEEALKRLEGIVDSMENDDLPLETLLARYEEGTRLAANCQTRLVEAEVKIQQLERKSNGQFALKPLSPNAPPA